MGPNNWYGFELDAVAPVGRPFGAVTIESSMGPNNWYGLDNGATFSLSWFAVSGLCSSSLHSEMAGSCLEIALGQSTRVGKFAKSEAISSTLYSLFLTPTPFTWIILARSRCLAVTLRFSQR